MHVSASVVLNARVLVFEATNECTFPRVTIFMLAFGIEAMLGCTFPRIALIRIQNIEKH